MAGELAGEPANEPAGGAAATRSRLRLCGLAAAVLLAMAGTPAAAACLDGAAQRAAIAAGQVVRPAEVRRAAGGELLDLSLCDEGGRLVYIAIVLRPDGAVKRVVFDARSGAAIRGR